MSITTLELFVRNAREQVSQRDIIESLLNAVTELTGEIKRLDREIHRVRREVQMSRRF